MDLNEKTELQFDKVSDGKGTLLEEYIYEHDRTIFNKANNAPTFMSGSTANVYVCECVHMRVLNSTEGKRRSSDVTAEI